MGSRSKGPRVLFDAHYYPGHVHYRPAVYGRFHNGAPWSQGARPFPVPPRCSW
jgi:hypothetical protein